VDDIHQQGTIEQPTPTPEVTQSQAPEAPVTAQAPQANEGDASTSPAGQPDKYQGKSREDVIDMYRNLERKIGEMGVWREKHDSLLSRIQELESRNQRDESDPLKLFEKEVAEDPKEAVANLVKRTREDVLKQVHGVKDSMKTQVATEYLQSQLKDNPDFQENWQTMQELDRQFGHVVSPEFRGSKEAVQLLYDLAKAKNLNKYVDKARQQQTSLKQEKRAAFSESAASGSNGREERKFEDLSLEEMERLLGRADFYR
jgi:dsDNA-specific endonuclease/ATPase MutS2